MIQHTTGAILCANSRDVGQVSKEKQEAWMGNAGHIQDASMTPSNLAMFRHQFRIMIQHTNASNSLVIKRYALLQSASFLFMLSTTPKFSETFLLLMDLDYECHSGKT